MGCRVSISRDSKPGMLRRCPRLTASRKEERTGALNMRWMKFTPSSWSKYA
jgi:hypothetical protein